MLSGFGCSVEAANKSGQASQVTVHGTTFIPYIRILKERAVTLLLAPK